MAQNERKQSRREFILNSAIVGAVILAIGGFVKSIFSYLLPEGHEKTYHKYLVAKHNELPIGKAKEITLAERPVFVVHLENGYKVFSGICTHLGCIVRWEDQKNHFLCPCHQGVFSKTGEVISGPPPRALDEYQVKVEDNLVFIMIEDRMGGPWS